MLTLLSELHFWSVQEDLCIKDSDYGAFKYSDKKDSITTDQSKKLYAEKRDYIWNVTNKRPNKLKEKLKELEEYLLINKIVYCKWTDGCILHIILNTGIFIKICVNAYTGDIVKISFDKFLVGKLLSESISDVLITRSHILCVYNDNRLTIVHSPRQPDNPDKLNSHLNGRVHVVDLVGPSGRKLDRRLSSNINGDKLLTWWSSSRDEVYPWSPLVKDEDRANIHVYTLYGNKLELICYHRTQFDLLDVQFDAKFANRIHFVEQKVSRAGVVQVEASCYEIIRNKLQQVGITSIPLQTQISCYSYSPDHRKLFLGCIDGSILIHDQNRAVTSLAKAAFIPTFASWHADGAVILLANQQCQLQCFDLALACLKSQVISEDLTPGNILDLGVYFKRQPTLIQLNWNNNSNNTAGRYLTTDAFILLVFEHGPLAVVRLLNTARLPPDALITHYLRAGHIDHAINMLLALDWCAHGDQSLCALQHLLSELFKRRLTPVIEAQIQKALGSWYAPVCALTDSIRQQYAEQIGDLTRKFFHTLVRCGLYEKAFCLAIDCGDHDLFMDLYYCALALGDAEMGVAALKRAKMIIPNSSRSMSSDDESGSICSDCSSSDENDQLNGCNQWLDQSASVPPLPVAETAAIGIPPPLPIFKSNRSLGTMNNFYKYTNVKPIVTPALVRFPTFSNNNLPRDNSIIVHSTMPPPTPSTRDIVHVHKTVSLTIPPAPSSFTSISSSRTIPAAPSLRFTVPLQTHHTTPTTSAPGAGSKSSSEKNVKFSDTVTAFIVPEIARNEKLLNQQSNRTRRSANHYLTDPKQELADSLPLCHPNDDYLKDFTPIQNNSEDENPTSATKIKVVHFGMV